MNISNKVILVIINRRGTRLRHDPKLAKKTRSVLPGTVIVLETESEEETLRKLGEISEGLRVDIVIVIGGDGTFRTVLNWVLSLPFSDRPKIIPVGGGHICYMAAFAGFWPRDPLRGLVYVLNQECRMKSIAWNPVRVSVNGEKLCYCAVFATGFLYDFLKWMEDDEKKHVLEVAWMILKSALIAFFFSPEKVGPLGQTHGLIKLNTWVVPSFKHTAVLASTVPRLSLGTRPFLGQRSKGQIWCVAFWGSLRALTTLAPFVWLGMVPFWVRSSISNQPRDRVHITTSDPRYMIDGCCKVVVHSGPEVDHSVNKFELVEGPEVKLLTRNR
ncbi:MAG: diacylglycerol kinase family protein [Patescibacteria group bacterium]